MNEKKMLNESEVHESTVLSDRAEDSQCFAFVSQSLPRERIDAI